MNARASVATRVAGAIGALGFLSGVVDGPIIGAVAGLALITFGRSALSQVGSELIAPAAFAVLAGAAGAAALRWGTLDLAEIRGAQGVLGPTIAVEPQEVALLAIAALLAASVSLGLWLGHRGERGTFFGLWWWVEALVGALFLAALFSGPPASDLTQAGIWLGSTAIVGAVAALAALLAVDRSTGVRFVVLGICGVVVTVAAAVAGSYA